MKWRRFFSSSFFFPQALECAWHQSCVGEERLRGVSGGRAGGQAGGAFWHLLALEDKWHKACRSDPIAENLVRVRRARTVGLCQALSCSSQKHASLIQCVCAIIGLVEGKALTRCTMIRRSSTLVLL